LRGLRDETHFRRSQEVAVFLREQETNGKFNIYFFDESGASLTPSIPYAWQEIGKTRELPSKRSKRLNILGFINRKNEGQFHFVEESVNSGHVIEAFDAFAARYAEEYAATKVPCLVVLDNAPTHHSGAFKAKIDDWIAQGVCLHYLPTYSPELNLIEILWRKLKYEWLPMSAYKSYGCLKENVKNILFLFGTKYKITFV
jgi:hypothetical protein